MNKIAVLLPYNESYDVNKFGAIALTVKDFICNSKYKDQIKVFGAHYSANPLTPNYQKLHFKSRWFTSKYKNYLKSFLGAVKKDDFKLIEIHNRPKWVRFLASKTDLPITIHLHNDPLEMQDFKTIQERTRVLNKVEKVICVSDWVKQRALSGVKRADKIITIYNIFNIECEHTSKKENIILYVGRITYEKGVIELFEAITKLLKHDALRDWEFVIIGKPRDTSFFNKSYQSLRRLLAGQEPRVKYIKAISFEEVIKNFSKAKIALLPSKWHEPFGRTILEALACGCALITSNTGAIPEIVATSGIILNQVTSKDIEEAVLRLVNAPKKIEDFSKKAVIRATEFSSSNKSLIEIDKLRKEFII